MPTKLAKLPRNYRITRLDDILLALDRMLAQRTDGPHFSFYLNSGRLPDDARRARITFRNQLAEARTRLREEQDFQRDDASLLAPCESLLGNEKFWRHQEEGLAVLVNSEDTEVLLTGAALPDKWIYSSVYYLKPLLALAAQADAYWLLTLSQKRVRLYRGSELGFRQVECDGLPDNYQEAISSRGFDPDSSAMVATESHLKADKEHLRPFLEVVQEAVAARLAHSGLPLLVAGVDTYAPIYRQLNSYPQLSGQYLEGNVDSLGEQELHEKASALLQEEFKKGQVRQLRRYKEAIETGAALDRLDLILAAASRGQIRSLFVPCDEDCWGTFDPVDATLDQDDGCAMSNTDLYELAARQTLDNGGEVFFLEAAGLPTKRKAIALLRWTNAEERDPNSLK